jgi:thiol-disulfide isomerase/thioredoxin
MKIGSHTLLAAAALVALAGFRAGAAPGLPRLDRDWDAKVVVNGLEIPCRFELRTTAGGAVGSFFNGDRRISSTSSRARDGGVVLAFAQYGATLDLAIEPGKLTGEYRRGMRVAYPFTATPSVSGPAAATRAPSIAGTWILPARGSKGEKAWRFIATQKGATVSASILRVDGDTGTLTGTFRDGRYVLSHFSGARPQLLEVTPQPDGTLTLRQNAKNEFVAVRERDGRATKIGAPADPDLHTTIADPAEPFRFSFPDLGGRIVANTDPQFAGRVVLVNVSGSWCPNCHDEAPFLGALYEKYHRRGLEIVTLAFEDEDQLADPSRLRAFIGTYGLKHTFLLAGVPDQLNEKVPQAVNLNAFPTTFILGRDGRVRGVHAGFPGPGSGEFYTKAVRDLSGQIERLLAERKDTRP